MSVFTANAASRPQPRLPILIAISMLAPLGLNIIQPSMPTISKTFAVPYADVALLISLYLAAMAIFQVILGPLSDKFGRRPIVLIGFSASACASFVCVIAPNMETLMLARIVQAIGGCTGIVLARAIVRDVFDTRHSASMLGYVTMGMAVAPMLAPLIGGILDDIFGWQAIFVFHACLALVLLVWAYFALGETAPLSTNRTAGVILREFFHLMQMPAFWIFAFVVALSNGVYFSFLGAIPLISEELLKLSSTEFGAYFMTAALGYILGNFLSGRFANQMGLLWMMTQGTLVLLLSGALQVGIYLLFGLSVWGIFVPLVLVGVANGVTTPSALAGAVSVRPDLAGSAAGLAGSLQIGTGAIAAYVASVFVTLQGNDNPDAWPMLMQMFLLSIGGTIAVILARRVNP